MSQNASCYGCQLKTLNLMLGISEFCLKALIIQSITSKFSLKIVQKNFLQKSSFLKNRQFLWKNFNFNFAMELYHNLIPEYKTREFNHLYPGVRVVWFRFQFCIL